MRRHLAKTIGVLAIPLLSALAQDTQHVDAFRFISSAIPPVHGARNQVLRRARTIAIDFSRFNARAAAGFRSRISPEPSRDSIRLNLLDDVSVNMLWDHVGPTQDGKGTVWSGSIEGLPFGEGSLVVTGSMMVGHINLGNGTVYRIEPETGGLHVIQEIDQSDFPSEGQSLQSTTAGAPATVPNDVDDGSIIDVMVLWTPAARQHVGGQANMTAKVQLGVELTNRGYANSGIIQRVRLVYAGEIDYAEKSFVDDLDALTDPNDGKMDEVHALRDRFGADIVSTNAENAVAVCWVLMTNPSSTFAPERLT